MADLVIETKLKKTKKYHHPLRATKL